MNERDNNRFVEPLSAAEETLRVIARLPAPDGLADRVQAGLRAAPRSSRVLRWPVWFAGDGFRYGTALRGAAAAAIVCVVAGGGWRIYSHVQTAPSAQALPVPARMGNGFSSAGAMRTPDSPSAPVLTHALIPAPQVPAMNLPAHPAPAHRRAKKHKKAAPAAVPQQ
jgi:hypothetical protein